MTKLREPITLTLSIKNGVIQNTPESIAALLKYDPFRAVIVIQPLDGPRSVAQNAFWHGIWLPIVARHLRHEWGNLELKNEDVCFYFRKRSPVTAKTVIIDGQHELFVRSTKGLKVGEMAEFLTFVEITSAQDFGVRLPPASFDHQLK